MTYETMKEAGYTHLEFARSFTTKDYDYLRFK